MTSKGLPGWSLGHSIKEELSPASIKAPGDGNVVPLGILPANSKELLSWQGRQDKQTLTRFGHNDMYSRSIQMTQHTPASAVCSSHTTESQR